MQTARIDAATGAAWQLVSPAMEKPTASSDFLANIESLDCDLEARFVHKLSVQPSLTRALVSFQANKNRVAYRWYKYKEAFSASLVENLLQQYGVSQGAILDPFAGSGTALFAARALGLDAEGVELLPIGQEIIAARKSLEDGFTARDFAELKGWSTTRPWQDVANVISLPELRITKGAYPPETLAAIQGFLATLPQASGRVRQVLRFALLCVLEPVSYTRKDGQYLRWDDRSGRRVGKKPCHKGPILDFAQAICEKINEIVADGENGAPQAELFPTEAKKGAIKLYGGSCLDILPTLPTNCYDAVITSPPYCNRYDYTRTYALELALLGRGRTRIGGIASNHAQLHGGEPRQRFVTAKPGLARRDKGCRRTEIVAGHSALSRTAKSGRRTEQQRYPAYAARLFLRNGVRYRRMRQSSQVRRAVAYGQRQRALRRGQRFSGFDSFRPGGAIRLCRRKHPRSAQR